MDLAGWDTRYRSGDRAGEDFDAAPTPLLVATAEQLRPGRALDVACGTGRNALWLAEHGWQVTAVDGSLAAIEALRNRAAERGCILTTRVVNLEQHEFRVEPSSWDLMQFSPPRRDEAFVLRPPSIRRLQPYISVAGLALITERPHWSRAPVGSAIVTPDYGFRRIKSRIWAVRRFKKGWNRQCFASSLRNI